MKTTIKKLLTGLLAVMLGTSLLGALPTIALAEGGELASTEASDALLVSPTKIVTERPSELTAKASTEANPTAAVQPATGSVPRSTADPDQSFQLIVSIPADETTFLIPTSSSLDGAGLGKEYDWCIDWGDGESETNYGTSANGSGIPHTYAEAGAYVITITPNGPAEAWLFAFGFNNGASGSNALSNKELVTAVLGPITPQMLRTEAQINGVAPAPDLELTYLFYNCFNLIQGPAMEGWDAITSVGEGFAANMFYGCSSLSELPEGFNLPQSITAAGDNFAYGMFEGCASLIHLPFGFSFPQGITQAGLNFALCMFMNCVSLVSLPDGFNLPQGILAAGDNFANAMFSGCVSLTALPENFNLPQALSAVEDSFALNMFEQCISLAELPAVFNLPQNLDSAGYAFAAQLFMGCSSLKFLPAGFTFPQEITTVGDSFAYCMFMGCISLGALPGSFNLPQSVTEFGELFAAYLFYEAGGESFQINNGFQLPAHMVPDAAFAFYAMFNLNYAAPTQNRSAISIIGDCLVPYDNRHTFDTHFKDILYVPINWGGWGQPLPTVGPPRSGDLNGDGFVTMDEVLKCAQAAMGDIGLSAEQLLAIDMDGDGFITMYDVMMVYQQAIL